VADRIEAATLLCAGAISGGNVTVQGISADLLTAVVEVLARAGACVKTRGEAISIESDGHLGAVAIEATPFPGIPTDVQAQLTAVLTRANGTSRVTDRVFPERFMHLPELGRMGAQIHRDGATAVIRGSARLTGANVMASDLRASAALVLAALAAEGETAIRRIYHLDRGYERLEQKLRHLGADVVRALESPASTPTLAAGEEHHPVPGPPHFLQWVNQDSSRVCESLDAGTRSK
jgi:UDP-N-acetylglucosamine 1-carboxyvinyltransferase